MAVLVALSLLSSVGIASLVSADSHTWGSGKTYRECTEQGLTNYGPKTGQKWVGGSYKNLYNCTAPTPANDYGTYDNDNDDSGGELGFGYDLSRVHRAGPHKLWSEDRTEMGRGLLQRSV